LEGVSWAREPSSCDEYLIEYETVTSRRALQAIVEAPPFKSDVMEPFFNFLFVITNYFSTFNEFHSPYPPALGGFVKPP